LSEVREEEHDDSRYAATRHDESLVSGLGTAYAGCRNFVKCEKQECILCTLIIIHTQAVTEAVALFAWGSTEYVACEHNLAIDSSDNTSQRTPLLG
jgi:hypothetical protein